MNKIIVEVGANDGFDTERFLKSGENLVYSFEPTIELNCALKNRFKHNENYFPMPIAVDINNGWSWFNVAGKADWGCSSLLNFNPNIEQLWGGRTDFIVTDRYRVPTMRLDTFMKIYMIDRIDYLWIDAQGCDFRVLQSLGNRINDVVKGKCEVAYEVNLYDGEGMKNNHIEVCDWLNTNGFSCEIIPHWHRKEADIEFKRRT